MVSRVVTGAQYGLRDWLAQRITAAVMALYSAGMAGWLLSHDLDYDMWTSLFSHDLVRTLTLLFLLSLFYHAWVGVRDIVMDYVKPAGMRLLLHAAVILLLILYAIWSVQILWSL